jgi:DNA-binding NarL/FixJ family response regulator
VISVLVADDHAVFAQTLAAALKALPDLEVAGVAKRADDARALVAGAPPDVAVLDVEMPGTNGIELARELRRTSPSTRVIMLTGTTDASLFAAAMDAGACGYLLKDAELTEVIDAIRRAAAGNVVVPQHVVGRLLEAKAPRKGEGADLTKRELEVLSLLAEGTDAKTLAKALGVTWHTARTYVQNVLTKLGARSQLEAVAKATKLGIIAPR